MKHFSIPEGNSTHNTTLVVFYRKTKQLAIDPIFLEFSKAQRPDNMSCVSIRLARQFIILPHMSN